MAMVMKNICNAHVRISCIFYDCVSLDSQRSPIVRRLRRRRCRQQTRRRLVYGCAVFLVASPAIIAFRCFMTKR